MATPDSRPRFMVSASRLEDGAVVYLTGERRWVERFDDAAQHDDPDVRDRELAFAKTDEPHVCGAHAIELRVTPTGQALLSMRERLRREGGARVRERLGYVHGAGASSAQGG